MYLEAYPGRSPGQQLRASMSGPVPLAGVLPAIVTPLTEDGRHVDEGTIESLVAKLADTGIGGLVTCGSTGEFSSASKHSTSTQRQRRSGWPSAKGEREHALWTSNY